MKNYYSRYLAACLCAALLFSAGLNSASGQASKPAADSTPANPNLAQYNQAINDFNAATRSSDPARTAKTISELQALTKTPGYQNDATVHNLLGYLYLTQSNPTAAIPELQTTVQLNPANLDAHNNLGNALRQTNQYDAAAVQYQYVLDHPAAKGTDPGPDPSRVKFNLATVLGQAGETDRSLTLFSELAATGNADASVYKNYGFFLQKAGRSADAAAALQKSATLNPKDASASLSAGELFAKIGQYDDAIASLTKALGPDVDPKLDPGAEYDAYFALGESYAAKQDNPQAIKEFETASTLQPQNAVPLYNKGVLQQQAGLNADAETSYRSALQKDPNNVQIQTALGVLLADTGNNAESASLLSASVPKMPQNAQAAPFYSRLGDVYARQKNYADANQARMQALSFNPDDTDTRVALADSYMTQKQYVSALTQYNIASQARPTDAAIQNQRGVAYKNLKQYPKALAAFKKAAALSPSNAQVENNIGVVYELLGKKPLAVAAYKKALALNPQLAEARQNLGRFASK
ncbi:MAG: tetratricopeptide repeat protein [Janthinobacterium lividum]